MKKIKKKSKSTNVLEIDQNDQHYKRYFNSIYGDECKVKKSKSPAKKNSLSFQQVKSTSFAEDDTNHKLNWRRLQLSRTKLKQTAKTSALFAGFAMVAIVELQFNNDPENPVPPNLLILFGICTILLVSIHILALMIATCILPSVETIALLDSAESVCESPHERLRFFIELAWTFSSVIGVFLFLAEVIILVWVKFWEIGVPLGKPGKTAALFSTIAFSPFILMFFFFAFYFYRDFATNKYEKSTKQIKELESIIVRLEQNDMTYCPNPSNSVRMGEWSGGQDSNNNSIDSLHSLNMINNQKRKFNSRPQFSLPNARHDSPNLFLKKLCKYASGSNDHLLNENTKQHSASVDQIDRSDLKNNLKNDLKSNLKLTDACRVFRNNEADCVRFSLDNVSFNTYNSLQQNSNVAFDTFEGGEFAGNGSCVSSRRTNSQQTTRAKRPNLYSQITTQSSKSQSINLDPTAINDQQSNDSNKMIRNESESLNSLSTIVV